MSSRFHLPRTRPKADSTSPLDAASAFTKRASPPARVQPPGGFFPLFGIQVHDSDPRTRFREAFRARPADAHRRPHHQRHMIPD